MFQLTPPTSASHDAARFWLDVTDKLIKLAAVFIGGLWTWWNYRKSRTYEQKLELEVVGNVFAKGNLYGDIKVVVKNIGATKHPLHSAGTVCDLSIIRTNLAEQHIKQFHIFTYENGIEPGEAIDDIRYWRIPQPFNDILWVKLALRVVSNGVEWQTSCLIRVTGSQSNQLSEVI
jgi:hypothetical protein